MHAHAGGSAGPVAAAPRPACLLSLLAALRPPICSLSPRRALYRCTEAAEAPAFAASTPRAHVHPLLSFMHHEGIASSMRGVLEPSQPRPLQLLLLHSISLRHSAASDSMSHASGACQSGRAPDWIDEYGVCRRLHREQPRTAHSTLEHQMHRQSVDTVA